EVTGNLAAEAWTLRALAGLSAMEGRFERARELLSTSRAMFEELGETLSSAVSHIEASIELLAGDHVAAEKSLRACHRALEEMGDKAFLSTTAAYLAQVIFVHGRSDEAERSEGLGLYEQKGNIVAARNARSQFGDLAEV